MARIRSVKPELFKHEGLFEAEMNYQLPLRLAFIGLFTCCDKEGRFRWQPRRLKLDVFPYEDIDFSRVLDALQSRGFIVKYDNQGEVYGCIPSWLRHQHINNREIASKLPPVTESTILEIGKLNIRTGLPHGFTSEMKALFTRESGVNDASVLEECTKATRDKEIELEEKRTIERERKINENFRQINQVFEHWKAVMNHPNAKLDQKRKSIISKSLRFGYGVDELCEAITGCSYTPHNMGDNERGQRFDGLHVILRDGDQIDRFIRNCKFPPKPVTDADRRTMANVATLQSWVSKKIAEEQ